MTTPMNMAPVSLADIAALLDTKVGEALARQDLKVNEALARQNEAAAKRDAVLRAEISALRSDMEKRDRERSAEAAQREVEAAQRETRLARDSGRREARLITITIVLVGAMFAAHGYIVQRGTNSAPAANNPPVTIQSPAVAPPAAAGGERPAK